MKKILFVSRIFDPNLVAGAYKSSYYVLKGLKEIKELKVYPIHIKRPEKKILKNTIKFSFIIKNLYKTIKKINPDVLYVHDQDDTPLVFPLLIRYPSVVCIHDIIPLIRKERKFLFVLYTKIYLLILRYLIGHRKIIICTPSKTTKRDLIIFGFPENRIFVNNWGVDKNLYKPLRKRDGKEIVIGFIGGYPHKNARKRIDLLVEAFLMLKKKYNNIKLVLAGRYYKEFVEKYKNDVEFLGILPEEKVPEFYNSIDIFVYPSEYEGFGMQIIEAMSCKTLVLASNIPVFREFLPKELLFNLTKEDIAKKIEEFLDKEKIEKYSEILYEKSKEYDWKKTIDRFVKIFNILSK